MPGHAVQQCTANHEPSYVVPTASSKLPGWVRSARKRRRRVSAPGREVRADTALELEGSLQNRRVRGSGQVRGERSEDGFYLWRRNEKGADADGNTAIETDAGVVHRIHGTTGRARQANGGWVEMGWVGAGVKRVEIVGWVGGHTAP